MKTNSLTDFQLSILYLVLLCFVYFLYRFERRNKKKKNLLIDKEEYMDKSYIKSVFLIILCALLFLVYFIKILF
jgi:cbb3-type cytochrome oxidase subunit 3